MLRSRVSVAAGLLASGVLLAETLVAITASGAVAGVTLIPVATASTGWTRVDVSYDHACGVKADTTLWCWGFNVFGQLGLGDTINRSVPTMVGTGYSTVTVGGEHTCGVKADASLWCWGYNEYGQLGLGDANDRQLPTFVGSGFSSVTAGDAHTCGEHLRQFYDLR